MLTRRRFLTIIAAAATLGPARAAPPAWEWRGRALGADARILLVDAEANAARHLFHRIEKELALIERHFSLFAKSSLTRLNRTGRLAHPAPDVLALFTLAGRVHAATGGAFDPTVQPLWRALAEGRDPGPARALVGWRNVQVTREEIRLTRPGMALTFNGIAQGFATDRVAELIRAAGFSNVLIDIGEIAGLGHRSDGAPWSAAIALADGAEVARTGLSGMALAVSSPGGTRIGPGGRLGHIIDPDGASARWRLAAVTAPSAALADGLSTAFCLMDREAIAAALKRFPGARLAALV
ncbi:FAD:protein FMN transferase [Rhodobium gokarnense]|uniref:FAD:protein FMN transferase n=1 Tax=Rhodobium gokarnense TaxID=364296 RepID=A0ABT3HBH5_9HYPH|nr:FAD:protein FMN transferase [Rhodobium gokarnense]MCW2307735.1 thiamine biosynthesis lipoprotein [Rhodobium gokarnense]